jgi:hypothetical protein
MAWASVVFPHWRGPTKATTRLRARAACRPNSALLRGMSMLAYYLENPASSTGFSRSGPDLPSSPKPAGRLNSIARCREMGVLLSEGSMRDRFDNAMAECELLRLEGGA